jgi:guanine nucleotide-binding protein G(i) subunit alpha
VRLKNILNKNVNNFRKIIAADNEAQRNIHKLLLLGAGESGKSTLFKQMTAIYGKGFVDDERKHFVTIIHQNINDSICILMNKVKDFGEGSAISTSSKGVVEQMGREENIDDQKAIHIKNVWLDPAVQATYQNRSKFQLTDSAAYFFERLKGEGDAPSDNGQGLVGEKDYLPSVQDVLRSRVRTTGIVKKEYFIDGSNFELYDVGGQRNERKKWIHCFDNVTAVLFVGVLSEYNQTLYEDETTNRMYETVKLFDEIVNAQYFANTDFILLLNKRDLFETKILEHKLTDCILFENHPETINNYEEGCKAIEEVFRQRAQDKNIFCYVTCATDTNLCKELLANVTMIIIQGSLKDAGLV